MSATKSRPSPLRSWLRVALAVLVVILLLPYLITPFYLLGRPVSTLMLGRWLTGARVERLWMPLDDMAPALRRAVIAAEDGQFCRHHGIDLGELREVLREAADDLNDVRGGSTITQQTAKNLFLWPGRSFVRKALELPLALWIDLVLGKRRVLEIYLNIAEWGPDGEFGAEAGARRALGHSARDLSPREAALMAAMLPDPVRRNAGHPSAGLRRLAGIYQRRSAIAGIDGCLRGRR
jgi:monofunctional biosynthetic peptidoglycan transglycosylase